MTETAGRLLRPLPLLTARPSWSGDELAARLGVTTHRQLSEEPSR